MCAAAWPGKGLWIPPRNPAEGLRVCGRLWASCAKSVGRFPRPARSSRLPAARTGSIHTRRGPGISTRQGLPVGALWGRIVVSHLLPSERIQAPPELSSGRRLSRKAITFSRSVKPFSFFHLTDWGFYLTVYPFYQLCEQILKNPGFKTIVSTGFSQIKEINKKSPDGLPILY